MANSYRCRPSLGAAVLLCLGTAAAQTAIAQTTIQVDTRLPWDAWLNAYEISTPGAPPVVARPWPVWDVKADFFENVISLSPTTTIAQDFWWDSNWIKPDGTGTRDIQTILDYTRDDLGGQTVTFAGHCLANTLIPGQYAYAYVMDATADWSILTTSTVPLVAGQPFTVSQTIQPGHHMQLGFGMVGPTIPLNVNPGIVQVSSLPTAPVMLVDRFNNDGSFESIRNGNWNVPGTPPTLVLPGWNITSPGRAGLIASPTHEPIFQIDGNSGFFADNTPGFTPNEGTATSGNLLKPGYSAVHAGDVFAWSYAARGSYALPLSTLRLQFGTTSVVVHEGSGDGSANWQRFSGYYVATEADAAAAQASGGSLSLALTLHTMPQLDGYYSGNVLGDDLHLAVYVPDYDSDGIPDWQDGYPHSYPVGSPITIGGIPTRVANVLVADGWTIDDRLQAALASARNRGDFVKKVKDLTKLLRRQNLITRRQAEAIEEAAEESDLPAKRPVTVIFQVDTTGYPVTSAGMRLAGTFGKVGATTLSADWAPALPSSQMQQIGQNRYALAVTFPASAAGKGLEFLFVRKDVFADSEDDYSEGNPGETFLDIDCAVDDQVGGVNRYITLPSKDAIYRASFDRCGRLRIDDCSDDR